MPRTELSLKAPLPLCVEPRKVMSFTEEAMILPGPVMKRWKAGRVLYGVGTTLSMTATTVASIGALVLVSGGSTTSLSDPGPALALAGTVGNITGTAFLVSGLAVQHSALAMIGRDSGRYKYIAGVVFGALGLASVGAGYIVGGIDIPNKDVINYAIGYGGTLLLTTSSSILISDARALAKIWDSLGMRPYVPVMMAPPSEPLSPPPMPPPTPPGLPPSQ